MIEIEYGSNNKEEKGKIKWYYDEEKIPYQERINVIKSNIDEIKELYQYMRQSQENDKMKRLLQQNG